MLYIVLEHCGGGNLMGLIQVEGPIDSTRMKRWACEIVSITFSLYPPWPLPES